MRTITQNAAGGPEVLVIAEIDDPTPGPGEVLVRVAAAGINPVDSAVRAGNFPLIGNPPFTVGWDISGTVEAVGPGVSEFAVGDDVFGMPRFPKQAAAYAEKIVAPAAELAAKPHSLDHVQAGALPLVGLTAWQGLVKIGGLKQGQRALIHGAAGGVGHIAVQIAKARGAHVVATASTAKLDFVRGLGADEVIDHTTENFTARVVPDGDGLVELARLADADQLEVHVERTFPLAEAGAAQAFLATKPKGKVALTI